jgi:hypothetical protein
VALGKMLNIGGMENSSPKTAQNPNRFRVARNVKPNSQGVISPRNSFTTPAGQPANIRRYPLLTQYDNSILKMAVASTNVYNYYLDNTLIPRSSLQGGTISGGNDNTSLAVMSFRKNNTTYILNPLSENSFFKYDGVEITGCGVVQPKINTIGTGYDASGTKWIKVIQHKLDFDLNEPCSETITFPILNSTSAIRVQNGGSFSNIISVTNPNVFPNTIISPRTNTTSDPYFLGSATYNAGTNDFQITTTATNISSTHVGCYVFVGYGLTSGVIGRGPLGQMYWNSSISSNPFNACVIALRIKSASPLILDCVGARYKETPTNDWVTATVNSAMASQISHGFRKMISVWISASKNGDYYFRALSASFPENTSVVTDTYVDTSSAVTADASTNAYFPINIGLILGNWYDTNSRKLCINTDYPFGGTFYGMTSYQDQILWWTDDLIYFSDPNLGGSIEHPSAGSFIRVGDSEFGKVISCCGTADYFVVSRERKNYIVNGNLATGNYRVQDISDIEIGAWCNNGMINIKDSVIMINALGVWQIQSGGRVSHLSKQIAKNFATYQPSGEVTDTWFSLLGTTSFPIVNGQDAGLDIAFDEYSELLFFCQRSSSGTPILVMHTKTGEFYEWTGVVGNFNSRGMTALNGELYIADVNGTSSVVKKENKGSFYTQDYAVNYPIQLYTTWLTSGEPSLEKQLLQFKMFGYVYTTSDRFRVVHFKDWDEQTKITNASYVPDKSTYPLQYSHLKRLNSDKVLAASVGIEISQTNAWFELESIEVEFNPIQQGVKR